MSDTKWMKDGVGKRPGKSTWTAQCSFGLQPARRCKECNRRHWAADVYPIACSCGGVLGPEGRDAMVRQRAGLSTRKAAIERRNAWRSMRDRGEVPSNAPAPEVLTLSEYLTRYLDGGIPWGEARPRPPTLAGYRRKVDTYIVPVIGNVPLTELRTIHVREVKDSMTGLLAPRTIRQTLTILHRALRRAVELELITVNPATAVTAPPAGKPNTGRLAYSDIERMVAAAEGSRWHLAIALAGATAMRRSELLGLTWDDVEYTDAGAWLQVRRGLHREAGEFLVLEPKSEAGRRKVPVGAVEAELLRRAPQGAAGAAAAVRHRVVGRTRVHHRRRARRSDATGLVQPVLLTHREGARAQHAAPRRPARRGDPAGTARLQHRRHRRASWATTRRRSRCRCTSTATTTSWRPSLRGSADQPLTRSWPPRPAPPGRRGPCWRSSRSSAAHPSRMRRDDAGRRRGALSRNPLRMGRFWPDA